MVRRSSICVSSGIAALIRLVLWRAKLSLSMACRSAPVCTPPWTGCSPRALRYLGGYPGLYQACAVACLLGAGLALTVRSSR